MLAIIVATPRLRPAGVTSPPHPHLLRKFWLWSQLSCNPYEQCARTFYWIRTPDITYILSITCYYYCCYSRLLISLLFYSYIYRINERLNYKQMGHLPLTTLVIVEAHRTDFSFFCFLFFYKAFFPEALFFRINSRLRGLPYNFSTRFQFFGFFFPIIPGG